MGKIKINLVSGTTLEKPLISCFKGTNANYIVLDNESNGSMGLPIIIISKLNGTNLEKIIDPNEWGAVKENLRTIISGTALPYLAVPETLSAPDDFFTQLTLPVASYDLLKSVYAPPAEPAPAAAPQEPAAAPAPAPAPAPEVPATPAIETPAEITLAPIPDATTPAPAPAEPTPAPVAAPVEAPVVNPTPAPAPAEAPVSAPVDTPAPVEPVVSEPAPAVEAVPATPAPVQAPVVEPVEVQAPTAVQTPVAAVAPATPAIQAPAADVASGQAPAIDLPQSQPAETVSSDADINKIKETFMKSCENMFDALMQKFQNK